MTCNEFRTRLTDLFDKNPQEQLNNELQKHILTCEGCRLEYESVNTLLNNLSPAVSFPSIDSGIKTKILNNLNSDKMENEKSSTTKLKISRKQINFLAIAASIAILLSVIIFTKKAPFINSAQAAENIMLRSITVMDALKSMFITMDVRSEPGEGFDFIGKEYDAIEYKLWKQFTGETPWRIEKPGRIVVFDGTHQYLYLKRTAFAIKSNEDSRFVEWMKIFFEPKNILENEMAFAKKHNAEYDINETNDNLILTVNANALGDFHNNYLKNNSILESDNSRVYTFDKHSMLLKSFELFIDDKGISTSVIKIKNVAYNIPIDASTFQIELPQGMEWATLKEPAYSKTYSKISGEDAAGKFFMALHNNEFSSIKNIWSAMQISDQETLNDLKAIYGGLELISLGEPFKSGLYPGVFVPYEIRLTSGEIVQFNLALRNDNPNKTWIVDGGI